MEHKFSSFILPIEGANPSGIDIEYDARFLELQRLVEGTPEQEYGDTIIEAKEPDWNAVDKLCCQLLSESKDIRLFCFYLQALTAKHGVIGFAHGCNELLSNLENHWDSIYPTLYDEDGDYDSYYRINAINLLTAKEGVAKQLSSVMLKLSANKRISINLKDAISILMINSNDELYPGGQNQLIMDIKVSASKGNEEIKAIEQGYKLLNEIQVVYQSKLSQESPPNFDVLTTNLKMFIDQIDSVDEVVDERKINEEHYIEDTASELGTISAHGHSSYADISLVQISNRKEVEILLEKSCVYFATYEPSHPAPLFIRRALRILDMNFYEIMQDVSPSSLDEVENLFGKMFTQNEHEAHGEE